MKTSLAVSLALIAAPVWAQASLEENVAAMTTAVEEAGCLVTAENGDAVATASGLTEEETMAVIAQMYTDGLVSLTEDGSMKLTNEVCQ